MKNTYYPRPEILARPELQSGHAVIEASAGTGKTFTLEHLVIDLLIRSEANIEEILVVTFTDAATRELRERVRALIRRICDEGSEAKPDGKSKHCWEVNEVTRGRLREALFRFDGAAISTIHGFCQRILSEQAFLGGRLFEQEHADGAEMFGFAFREEVRMALVESGPVGDTLRFWIEQENSLHQLEDFLYRCHREGSPDRCLVTPKWDPQGFMKAMADLPALEDLQASGQIFFTDKITGRGFTGLFERLSEAVAAMHSAASPRDAFSHFTEWTNKECSINKVKTTQIEHLYRAAGMEGAPDPIKKLAAGLNEMALRAAPEGSFFAYELLPRVQSRLAARKRSLGLIDYDDMLLGVREALTGADAGVLLDALRRRWKYALVDEFQDTDPVQWEIFRRIFVDGRGQHRLFVIGDPKQAIYGFRGADVHTYDLAKNHLLNNCSASRLPLLENYRSTEALIEAVNEILLARDSAGNSFFDGLNRYDEPVNCGDLSRMAIEGGKPAAPVHLIHLHGGDENLNAASIKRGVNCFIAGEILRLTNPESGLVTGSGGKEPAPIKLSDIYILTRTGSEGRQIGDELRRHGIAHAFYKQDGLFNTAEADHILRLLGAIESPADPAARMSAWLTPFFGVPLDELPAWQDAGESHQLTSLLFHWKRLADAQAWTSLFEEIQAGSGLARRLIFSEDERALTNYIHLFEVLLADTHAHPVTLRELARSLQARIDGRKLPEGREGDIQRLETDKEAVQILTMHKAKGLEAEVIFIGGGFGNPGGFGLKMDIYHHDNERRLHIGKATGEIALAIEREIREENQRLAYVAMTRARSRLYLPYFGAAAGNTQPGRSYGYNRLGKFYNALQKQLDLLQTCGRLNDQGRFACREASCMVHPPVEKPAVINLEGWPGEKLLEPLASSAEAAGKIEPRHRGILLTSYTRMKRGKSWQPPAADTDGQAAWRSDEVGGEVIPDETVGGGGEDDRVLTNGATDLPGGREAGIFLHALLEDTTAEEIETRSLHEWASLQTVQKRAAAAARRHGFAEDHLPGVLEMVYNALKTPLKLQSREKNALLEMPGGIVSGSNPQAEMAFLYPIPENFHPFIAGGLNAPAAGDRDSLPYKAWRGYLQGLIDLIFEYKGKIYLLDWKSDRLPAFDESSLDAHVGANYSLQARVYALAVVRLLGIRSEEEYEDLFGGVLYLFIRGIRPEAEGQSSTGAWFSRPLWCDATSWEPEFAARREWGGTVIENRG